MKNYKEIILVFMALTMLVFLSACGRNAYHVTKTTASYKVDAQIDHNPPVAGNNVITLNIKDNSGKDVTDAKVIVGYDMPAMPGMPPMSHIANTTLEGKLYKANIDLMMAGPWTIYIHIERNGKAEATKFSIDAR